MKQNLMWAIMGRIPIMMKARLCRRTFWDNQKVITLVKDNKCIGYFGWRNLE